MIKFIATDLDGTLLPDSSKDPTPEDFEAIKKLQQRGVLFAAASGRQYDNLKRLFGPVSEDMVYICENGALIMYRGERLSITEIPHDTALDIIRDIQSLDGCEAQISTDELIRIVPKDPGFPDDLRYNWNTEFIIAPSIESLTMPIIKISLYQKTGLTQATIDHLKANWGGRFNVAVSGKSWIDVTVADKGTATRKIKEHFGFSPDEMAVFGDNFNDIQMLDEVTHGFVMKNAVPEIHKHGKYVCNLVRESLNEILDKNLEL